MTWSNRYIGIPRDDHGHSRRGADCWGLLRLIYRAELGLRLPSYRTGYLSADEATEIAGLIATGCASPVWRQVTGAPQAFDAVLLRCGRLVCHVGIAIGDGRMLHLHGVDHAKIARLADPLWTRRLAAVYRHVEAPLKGAS